MTAWYQLGLNEAGNDFIICIIQAPIYQVITNGDGTLLLLVSNRFQLLSGGKEMEQYKEIKTKACCLAWQSTPCYDNVPSVWQSTPVMTMSLLIPLLVTVLLSAVQ